VDALVHADLAEQAGERFVGRVARCKGGVELDVLPFGVLGEQRSVLMLGVIFDIGVEPVASGGVVGSISLSFP
jgi:hypothetical protein